MADVHGSSAGMHLALRLKDNALDDVRMSARLLDKGIAAPALSQHAVGLRTQPWRGFLLGYAQVPVDKMASLVSQLARVIRSEAAA